MKIAFTHNIMLSTSEQEAEFDRPDTIQAIANSLTRWATRWNWWMSAARRPSF